MNDGLAPPPVAPAPVAPVLSKFINTTNVCFANSACNLILNSPWSNFCRDGALEAISAFRHDPSMAHDVRDVLQTCLKNVHSCNQAQICLRISS